MSKLKDLILKIFGFKFLFFLGDPSSYDRWQWLKLYLKRGNLRTLDAGCGSGAFTMYASSIGNNSIGISYDKRNNEVAIHRAKLFNIKNIEFITHDLRQLSSIKDRLGLFDQIICFETIEHIMDDKKLIANLASLLKDKGCLILTTPYKHYIPLITDHISDVEDGDHVRWGYTHEEIKEIFNSYNIDLEITDYISGFVPQQIMNLQRILCQVNWIFAWLFIFPLRVLQCFDKPLTKALNYPYMTIGVVGVKR